MKENINDREYKIKHYAYDKTGKIVNEFYIKYEENETADAIYLTDKVIKQIAKQVGVEIKCSYKGYDKPVYYQSNKNETAYKLDNMLVYEKDEELVTVILTYVNGLKKEFIINK